MMCIVGGRDMEDEVPGRETAARGTVDCWDSGRLQWMAIVKDERDIARKV